MAFTPQNLQQLSQQAGSKNQQLGTGYTNLNRVMDANKGNKLGQQVAGNLQGQVSGIQNQLGEQQKQFQTETDKNAIKGGEKGADTQARDAVIGRFAPSSTTAGAPVTDEESKQMGRFTSGTYTGPQGLKDTSALSTQAGQLKQQTSNLSPSGTQELLRRSFNNSKYNQGQQGLDTMLMGQGNQSAMVGAQRQAGQLGSQIQKANLQASGTAELNKNQAQQFADQTKGLLGQNLQGIDTQVQGQLKSAQQAEATRRANLAAIQSFQQNQGRSSDRYAQMDQLQNMLRSQGVSEAELAKQFGTGSAVGAEQSRAQQVTNTDRQSQLQAILGNRVGNGLNMDAQRYAQTLNPDQLKQLTDRVMGGQETYGGPQYQEDRDTYSSERSRAIGDYNARLGQEDENRKASLASQQSGINAAAYNQLGSAGQALAGGSEQQMYTDLATRLANSGSNVQGINAQGVASGAQIGNYNALNKLMGGNTSQYQDRVQQVDPSTGKPMVDAQGNPIYNTQKYRAGGYSIA